VTPNAQHEEGPARRVEALIRKWMAHDGGHWISPAEMYRECGPPPPGITQRNWQCSLRNKMQRECGLGPKIKSPLQLPVTPCHARGRDIPQAVWDMLDMPPLMTQPPVKGGRCYGWAVSAAAPRTALRWFKLAPSPVAPSPAKAWQQ